LVAIAFLAYLFSFIAHETVAEKEAAFDLRIANFLSAHTPGG
jgi:hypothetical protein